MLKVRVLPTLLYKEIGLVKGVKFDSSRRIGGALQAIKVYNLREVDEIVFLDISASLLGKQPDFELIDELADECFVPMTVGGGVRSLDDVQRLLRAGADKIALNSAAVEVKDLVGDIARRFGSQCVVVSLDARRNADGRYETVIRSGTKSTGLAPVEFAKQMEREGAGELLITSIDRDGTMEGYDLGLLRQISQAVSIQVIASGGAGNYAHMDAALIDGGASAIAAASIFHFTEQTPLAAKQFLRDRGHPVRI